PKAICDIAWRAQVRLCGRYRKLLARGKHPNTVTAAIARELVAFMWAIARVQPVTAEDDGAARDQSLEVPRARSGREGVSAPSSAPRGTRPDRSSCARRPPPPSLADSARSSGGRPSARQT